MTVILVVGLFLLQRRGTARVGEFFGPVMALWFVAIAVLGLAQIVQQWHILLALNPFYGLNYLASDPWRGFLLLGAVVLAVTRADALHAGLGHFGVQPVRRALPSFSFPPLVVNDFRRVALLLAAVHRRT